MEEAIGNVLALGLHSTRLDARLGEACTNIEGNMEENVVEVHLKSCDKTAYTYHRPVYQVCLVVVIYSGFVSLACLTYIDTATYPKEGIELLVS